MVLETLFIALAISPTPQESFDLITVPEGYTKIIIAAEPLVMDPVSFCFDDEGNIFVAESFRQENAVPDNRSSPFWLEDDLKSQTIEDRLAMYEYWADQRIGGMDFYYEFEERVRKLSDRNSDGIFETVSNFADGFNQPLDGTGAGLLAMEDEVWFTMIPSLIRLQDKDHDDFAEIQEVMYTGFGVRVALRGHDMHGLAIGLDGRLYWSIGDRGYHLELEDGRVMHSPGEGGVFRCELDGSNLELFHHGLRNPQELAFDKFGNLFTGDNNSDAGDKARLVYCVEGGETGWRMEYQTMEGENKRGPWVQENGWDPHAKERPAWILPAIDTIGSGPSGLVYYPGGGLEPRYDDHFFLCDFRGGASYSRVLSFEVAPEGAGFTMEDLHPFVEGVLCTDVDFGYDGRMVISDWGEGWQGNEEGRLYAVWDEKHIANGNVSEIFRTGFKEREEEELVKFLAHQDRRVRIRAQLELAERIAVDSLVWVVQNESQLPRLHAMWALAMINRQGEYTMDQIAPLLGDSDPEIRAHAARILGESGQKQYFEHVVSLIEDESPRVSFFATIASGHLGNPMTQVVEMLAKNNNNDVYLRHAGVVAIADSQYVSGIANLLTHESSAVRLAAVLALRKKESELIEAFLQDDDLKVATEAAIAIHDVPIQKSLSTLADSLNVAKGYAWQRRALSACQRLGKDEHLVDVIAFAQNTTNNDRMRSIALQILNTWDSPPNREIVNGIWWPAKRIQSRSIDAIEQAMPSLIEAAQGNILLDVLTVAQSHLIPLPLETSVELLKDETQPIKLRVFCLENSPNDDSISYGLQSDAWQLRAIARDVKIKRGDTDAPVLLLQAVQDGDVHESQKAIQSLKDTEAFSKIEKEGLSPALQFDYAEVSGDLQMFGDPLSQPWSIEGGSVNRGKYIVFEHSGAQCLRCHKVGDHGGIAGPTLSGIGTRLTGYELLESMMNPSAVVVEGFGDFSAMPPTGTHLSQRDMRDVVAYLKTLR